MTRHERDVNWGSAAQESLDQRALVMLPLKPRRHQDKRKLSESHVLCYVVLNTEFMSVIAQIGFCFRRQFLG